MHTAQDEQKHMQDAIVHDFQRIANSCREWGMGCPCHEEERQNGFPVDCWKQGRRAPEITALLSAFKTEATQRIAKPAIDMCTRVQLNQAMEESRTWLFKSSVDVVLTDFHYIDMLPWKMCRARHPRILRECRDTWLASSEKKSCAHDN